MLRGVRAVGVLQLSKICFSSTLSSYLHASSVQIFSELQAGSVDCHSVSTSSALFGKGASESLRIAVDCIHGIELKVRNRFLSEELVCPVLWNGGKRNKVQQIVDQACKEHPGSGVYVLAGLGDNYAADGPFLEFIARRSLPAAKPISVFCNNTDAPAEYRGLFCHTSHRANVCWK